MSLKFYKRGELKEKLVIDQNARIVGNVEDLAITEDGQMGISIKSEEGDEKMLKLDEIQRIADVILLKTRADERLKKQPPTHEPDPDPEPETETEEKIEDLKTTNVCPNCGWENRSNVQYCVKCGTKLVE